MISHKQSICYLKMTYSVMFSDTNYVIIMNCNTFIWRLKEFEIEIALDFDSVTTNPRRLGSSVKDGH